jgi:hypothetical protein
MKTLVVTSVRNESLWIVEWIAYYRALGVDYFLIYTNDNTDRSMELFGYLGQLPYIEVHENVIKSGAPPQRVAFNKAFKRIVELRPEWVICIDPDEYLNIKFRDNLTSFFTSFPDCDAIAINWRFFGSSGLQHKGVGFTTERFLKCSLADFKLNRHFKSAFRANDKVLGFGPHRPWFRNELVSNVSYCFPTGEPVSYKYIVGHDPTKDSVAYVNFDQAQINHYATRSISEYLIKKSRGNGNKPNMEGERHFSDNYFDVRDRNEGYDDSILRMLPAQKREYLDIVLSLGLSPLLTEIENDFEEGF